MGVKEDFQKFCEEMEKKFPGSSNNIELVGIEDDMVKIKIKTNMSEEEIKKLAEWHENK